MWKGDFQNKEFLIEAKATEHKSIILRKSWLEKLEREALEVGKTPLLLLTIGGRNYYMFRECDIDLNETSSNSK